MEKRFHYLVRSVCEVNHHILLVRDVGGKYSFLPGGHVELGESLTCALKRELQEELGLNGNIRNYLGAVEHQWDRPNVKNFEINHLFRVTLPGLTVGHPPISKELKLEFFWASTKELQSYNLQPYPLQWLLAQEISDITKPLWASTLTES